MGIHIHRGEKGLTQPKLKSVWKPTSFNTTVTNEPFAVYITQFKLLRGQSTVLLLHIITDLAVYLND